MVKLKLTRKKILILILIAGIFSGIFLYMKYFPRPITTINYGDRVVAFRQDIREAAKVPVFPTEGYLYNELIHQQVQNITIVFKPVNFSENAYYVLEEFEIIPKLTLAYERIRTRPSFNGYAVDSYENLPGKIQNPIIALVHPAYANETAVVVDGHVIYIKGKTHKDFDLATIKFLLVALDVNTTKLTSS